MERVIFAGGGTGGHVFMATAIASELTANFSTEVLFIGTEGGLESRIVPKLGFQLKTIRIGGLKKMAFSKRLRSLAQIPLCSLDTMRLVRGFRPSVVVGVGGYSSGPVVLISSLLRYPSLIIEPNAFPGFTNRLLSRFIDRAAVAFQETADWFGHEKAIVTGIPVRKGFHEITRAVGERSRLQILIFGGSQGSVSINSLMLRALQHLNIDRLQILHQTGKLDFERVRREYEKRASEAKVTEFIDDMAQAFEWSDLIICRAGGSTIAELTASGRPSILIPFPHAADDHQLQNALAIERKGAALVLEEEEATPEDLARIIEGLNSDRPRLRKMSAAAKEHARPKSTHQIIRLMEEISWQEAQTK